LKFIKPKYSKSTLDILILIFDIHPLFLFFTGLINLLLFLAQLYLHLTDSLFNLLVDDLSTLFDLIILFDVFLATVEVVELEAAVG
jgi:hypothetical protein